MSARSIPTAMQLSELIAGLAPLAPQTCNMDEREIRSIEFDSRKVQAGALYVAVKGERHDGHDFVADAQTAGAVAIVCQRRVTTSLPQVIVKDTRAAMPLLARRFYGNFPDLKKIGVTGTNGKTTTTFLIHSILSQSGKRPALIGTVYYLGMTKEKAARTTPELLDIYRLFSDFTNNAMDSVVMEVSSHALKLDRVESIEFDVAVFTNISHDHLDFHHSMDDYLRTKLRLFSLLRPQGHAVYNLDDPSRPDIESMHLAHAISYGRSTESDICGRIIEESLDGLRIEVRHGKSRHEIASPLVGDFNLYNILAAFGTAIAMDVDSAHIVRGIEALERVPGRMERVCEGVFVDYAHTPDALESVLNTVRRYSRGRLTVVFGCGGDRDRGKRPKMGAIAARLADLVIITSDNPRNEPPRQIIDGILQGISGTKHRVIEDRAAAIEYAVTSKEAADIVVVAGKGHEEYQSLGDQITQFSDKEEIRKWCASSRSAKQPG